jgi:hypothetical protein
MPPRVRRCGPIVIPLVMLVHVLVARAEEPIAPTFGDVPRRADPEAAYVAGAYTVVHLGDTGRVNEDGSSWRPVRGLVYRLSVDHDVFFESLGRPDLARQYDRRRSLGETVEVAGYILAVGGVLVVPWSLYKGSGWGALIGAGALVGGVVARGVGEDIQKPTFPEDEAIDMVNRYNQALRDHLQLPPLHGALGVSMGGRF